MSYFHHDQPSRSLQVLWLLIAFAVVYFFLSQTSRAAEPRQVSFYVEQPACADRKVGYVTLAGRNKTTEELHRVWICGLGVR